MRKPWHSEPYVVTVETRHSSAIEGIYRFERIEPVVGLLKSLKKSATISLHHNTYGDPCMEWYMFTIVMGASGAIASCEVGERLTDGNHEPIVAWLMSKLPPPVSKQKRQKKEVALCL